MFEFLNQWSLLGHWRRTFSSWKIAEMLLSILAVGFIYSWKLAGWTAALLLWFRAHMWQKYFRWTSFATLCAFLNLYSVFSCLGTQRNCSTYFWATIFLCAMVKLSAFLLYTNASPPILYWRKYPECSCLVDKVCLLRWTLNINREYLEWNFPSQNSHPFPYINLWNLWNFSRNHKAKDIEHTHTHTHTNLLDPLLWFVSGRLTAMVSNGKFIASHWTAYQIRTIGAVCVSPILPVHVTHLTLMAEVDIPYIPKPNQCDHITLLCGYWRLHNVIETVYIYMRTLSIAANDPTEDFLELQLSETY